MEINELKTQYKKVFNKEPTDYIRCGGRFEILGNHTDHNHGKCIAATCDLSIYSACEKNNTNTIKIYSKGYGEFEVNLDSLEINENEKGTSSGIIRGVSKYLKEKGYKIGGFNMYMESQIFPGAGVSSSAAFELLIGETFNELFNENKIERIVLSKAGQFAENNYYGKNSGLLDQIGVAFGGFVSIDFINIDNPKVKPITMDLKDYSFILVNTGGDHSLMSNLYSKIPLDMYDVAHKLGVNYLRESTLENLNKIKDEIETNKYERALHFYKENERVDKAIVAIENGDIKSLINLMNESRKSSTDLLKNMMVENHYQGSPLEACELVDKITNNEAGAKINGGGFAGSIVCLVNDKYKNTFIKTMKEKYGKGNVYEVNVDNKGVGKIE